MPGWRVVMLIRNETWASSRDLKVLLWHCNFIINCVKYFTIANWAWFEPNLDALFVAWILLHNSPVKFKSTKNLICFLIDERYASLLGLIHKWQSFSYRAVMEGNEFLSSFLDNLARHTQIERIRRHHSVDNRLSPRCGSCSDLLLSHNFSRAYLFLNMHFLYSVAVKNLRLYDDVA